MKISVITASFNAAGTLEDCFRSLRRQTHGDVEHIVIDGGSTDGAVEIIRRHAGRIAHWVSEPDRGVYHALNKGLDRATGDAVGFLHADDLFADESVLERVADGFEKTGADACYGDLQYVSAGDTARVIRHWKAGRYRPGAFRLGWMPPHPTFYTRRELYGRLGAFREDFRIAADYELMLRFFERGRIRAHYLKALMVKMRVGGISNRSLPNLVRKSWEDCKAWQVNGLSLSPTTIFLKNAVKIPQFFSRRSSSC